MRRKPKRQPPETLAPVASEILDQFVRHGPITAEERGGGPPVQESDHRARPRWRADASSGLSAGGAEPESPATGRARRPCSRTTGRWRLTCRAIASVRSSRS